MKRRELEERLKRLGWWFVRHGARHDLWTNGVDVEAIPRHVEVNEITARKILKNAKDLRRANKR
jgi:mRNA interferase HicA